LAFFLYSANDFFLALAKETTSFLPTRGEARLVEAEVEVKSEKVKVKGLEKSEG